jgi:hypothetical protein
LGRVKQNASHLSTIIYVLGDTICTRNPEEEKNATSLPPSPPPNHSQVLLPLSVLMDGKKHR